MGESAPWALLCSSINTVFCTFNLVFQENQRRFFFLVCLGLHSFLQITEYTSFFLLCCTVYLFSYIYLSGTMYRRSTTWSIDTILYFTGLGLMMDNQRLDAGSFSVSVFLCWKHLFLFFLFNCGGLVSFCACVWRLQKLQRQGGQ